MDRRLSTTGTSGNKEGSSGRPRAYKKLMLALADVISMLAN